MFRVLDWCLLALGLLCLFTGGYWGLAVAPTETAMGDVYRIMFVHVPCAWTTMIAFFVTFIASTVFLLNSSQRADRLAEASAEVGVVTCALMLLSGSIWGKPTWGVWWAWDPRLTWAAIMFFSYAGYLALRQFVETPDKRSTWAAATAIIISINIPIVWFSVKWWASLHQEQSTPKTIPDPDMQFALRMSAFALLVLYVIFVRIRMGVSKLQHSVQEQEPPTLVAPGAEEGSAA